MRRIRSLVLALAACAVGYWLFADTAARYRGRGRVAGEIRFSYWGGYDDHRMWRKVIEAFQSHRPDLHVVAEWLPLSGYGIKIDQQLVAGDAPDVIMFQDEPFPRYAGEQFADLGPFLEDDPETQARLAERDLTLTLTDAAKARLARDGIVIFGDERAGIARQASEKLAPPATFAQCPDRAGSGSVGGQGFRLHTANRVPGTWPACSSGAGFPRGGYRASRADTPGSPGVHVRGGQGPRATERPGAPS